ncbi:MAG TPA: hypothetical protein VEI99_01070, partial [Terriglobales bacterium]|nr:hypothetical protein [Terriglobales bacterium]
MRLNRRWGGVACFDRRVAGALALLVSVAVTALLYGPKLDPGKEKGRKGVVPAPGPAKANRPVPSLAHLPFIFERNQGQSDPRVMFLARGSRYALFLTADAAVLTLEHAADSKLRSANSVAVLSMELVHSNPRTEIKGTDQLPGKSN